MMVFKGPDVMMVFKGPDVMMILYRSDVSWCLRKDVMMVFRTRWYDGV